MTKQKLQKIRQTLYLHRDGASSSSMREKGLDYKLIWGVPVTSIRKIAQDYYPDPELADELWQQTTRELKILATMVQDPSSFSQADGWIASIDNPELAEQATINLFSKLQEASTYANQWIQSDNNYYLLTGILLYIRLFLTNYAMNTEEEQTFLAHVIPSLGNSSLGINYKALNALNYYIGEDKSKEEKVIVLIHASESLSEEVKSVSSEQLF